MLEPEFERRQCDSGAELPRHNSRGGSIDPGRAALDVCCQELANAPRLGPHRLDPLRTARARLDRIIVLTMRKPYDRGKITRAMLHRPLERTHQGKTFYSEEIFKKEIFKKEQPPEDFKDFKKDTAKYIKKIEEAEAKAKKKGAS